MEIIGFYDEKEHAVTPCPFFKNKIVGEYFCHFLCNFCKKYELVHDKIKKPEFYTVVHCSFNEDVKQKEDEICYL